jgi:hypothetical protein
MLTSMRDGIRTLSGLSARLIITPVSMRPFPHPLQCTGGLMTTPRSGARLAPFPTVRPQFERATRPTQ